MKFWRSKKPEVAQAAPIMPIIEPPVNDALVFGRHFFAEFSTRTDGFYAFEQPWAIYSLHRAERGANRWQFYVATREMAQQLIAEFDRTYEADAPKREVSA